MRKDIQLNTKTGDLVLEDSSSFGTLPFEWLEETDLVIRGQVILPSNYDGSGLEKKGVRVQINYTPVCKPMQIRFVRDLGEGNYRAVMNTLNNSEWFDVYTKLYGEDLQKVNASQLLEIHDKLYLFKIIDFKAFVYAGVISDFPVAEANEQNRDLLLQCVPTNSYRYPGSGVGLIRYLHASLEQTNLAQRLQKEFKEDGVTVLDAEFDSEIGTLKLKLRYDNTEEKEE